METDTCIVSSSDRMVACPLVLTKRNKILSGPTDMHKLFQNRLLSPPPTYSLHIPPPMLNVSFPPLLFSSVFIQQGFCVQSYSCKTGGPSWSVALFCFDFQGQYVAMLSVCLFLYSDSLVPEYSSLLGSRKTASCSLTCQLNSRLCGISAVLKRWLSFEEEKMLGLALSEGHVAKGYFSLKNKIWSSRMVFY